MWVTNDFGFMSHNSFLVVNIIPHKAALFPILCEKPLANLQAGIGKLFVTRGTNRIHFKLNNLCAIPQGRFAREVTRYSLFPQLPEPSAIHPEGGCQRFSFCTQSGKSPLLFVPCSCEHSL